MRMLFQIGLLALLAVPSSAELPDLGKWRLSTDGEFISLEANRVPLAKLVAAINEFTPAEIDMDDLPERDVTLRYQSIPIGDLLTKLNVSYVLTYARNVGEEDYELESAWVGHFRAGPGARAPAAGPSTGQSGDALPVGGVMKALGYQSKEALAQDVGVIHRVPFPLTMKIDGDVSDWPEDMAWHKVGHAADKFAAADGLTPVGVGGATNDADASMMFASSADQTNLYMVFKIRDDMKVLDRREAEDGANSDSLAISIGGVTNIIRRHNVWRVGPDGELTGSGRQFVSLNNDATAVIVDGADGWEVEMQMRHGVVGLRPENASSVPLDVALNDDDDGGDRDTQLRWSWAATSSPSSPPQLILQDLVP